MSQHDLAAACRDLLEEAERLERAFHKNFDPFRLLGKPKPFLQGPRYATRIARARISEVHGTQNFWALASQVFSVS